MRTKKLSMIIAGVAGAGLFLGACGGGDSDGSGGSGGGDGTTMRLALNQTEEHPS